MKTLPLLLMAGVAVAGLPGAAAASDRVLRAELEVAAPVADVWRASTTDQGIASRRGVDRGGGELRALGKKTEGVSRSPRPRCYAVIPRGELSLADVRRLQALRALRHVELNALTFGQGLEAVALNGGEMDKHVLATFLRDKAETLRLVEPLHGSSSH